LETDSKAEELLSEVKEIALESGASLVGIVSARTIDSCPTIKVEWKIQEYAKKTRDIMPDPKSIVIVGYHVWDNMLELAIKMNIGFIQVTSHLVALEQTVKNHLEKNGCKVVTYPQLSQKRLAHLAGSGTM